MVAMAAGKGEKESTVEEEGEKGAVVEKGENGSTVAEKGKGVAEKLAGGDMITLKSSDGKPFEVSKEAVAKEATDGGMITLKSSDGKPFEVSKEAVARLSTFLAKEIVARGCSEGGIKLANIASEPLERVVDYCNKHANSDTSAAASSSSVNTVPSSKELEEWDRELVGRLSQDALFDLTEAADFLGMDGLLDVTSRKIADMMRGKNTAQIREMFNIKNDYTEEEEEEEIRRENAWAFTLL